jgi:two-component system, cell cycle response regulator
MRLRAKSQGTGHRIAVVEDDAALRESTAQLLVRDGHEVRTAESHEQAVELIRSWSPHLVLLDYYLSHGTGESVVREVRTFDERCQVLLVTGYASEQPARKLLADLEIQGYHDKSDGPQRLMVLVDAALKHYRALDRIARQRAQLRHILDVSPEITRIQPVSTLLETALRQLGGLLRGGDGFIATTNSGLFVLGAAAERVSIQAAIGRFSGVDAIAQLPPALASLVLEAMVDAAPRATGDGFVVVPLLTRTGDAGCMIVEAAELPADAVEACELYGRQVTQALENVLLYERVTVDAMSRLHTRDVGLQRLDEALRLGERIALPTSVVMLDVDHFKRINDTFGHAAGDLAIRSLGAAVRGVCRTTDIASRHGGEEVLVVLPATDGEGALALAERLRARIAAERFLFEGQVISMTASLGVATAPTRGASGSSPEPMAAHELVRRADIALYRAKRTGRDRVCAAGAEDDAGLDATAA